METKVSSATKEVIISGERSTVLIGERINPTGRKKLTQALRDGDLELVRQEAIAQVKAGADIIDVNVGATGIDEAVLLPKAVQVVMEAVDVPLCLIRIIHGFQDIRPDGVRRFPGRILRLDSARALSRTGEPSCSRSEIY